MAKKAASTKEIAAALKAGPREHVTKATDFLSTGSSVLNLAISDDVEGGIPKGTYMFIVGDSSSGKTILAITLMAEAAINPAFDDYDIIYDNSENGAFFDVRKLFGRKVAERIGVPAKGASHYVEDFYFNVDAAYDSGRPFIYLMDSMDSLSSQEEEKKVKEIKSAIAKKGSDKALLEVAGLMSDGKAKKNSYLLRRVVGKLEKTGSILVILSQTRDNMDSAYDKDARSGGRALKFYSSVEVWLRQYATIRKTVNGIPRQTGIITECRVKKNRVQGKVRTVNQPIYYSVGLDDVGGLVDYLVAEKRWTQADSGVITAPEFDQKARRETLIKYIQENDLDEDLRALAQCVWREVEMKCVVVRKNKYDVE